MVSFELSKETEIDVLHLVTSVGQTKKNYLLFHSINKCDAIDIAHPSSIQDECCINFEIDLTHQRVSVVQ